MYKSRVWWLKPHTDFIMLYIYALGKKKFYYAQKYDVWEGCNGKKVNYSFVFYIEKN